jgi:hypothetical protein
MANSTACTCSKGHDAKEGAKGVDTAMVEDGACREEKDSVEQLDDASAGLAGGC